MCEKTKIQYRILNRELSQVKEKYELNSSKISFLRGINHCEEKQNKTSPKNIRIVTGLSYRHILRLGKDLNQKELIKRIIYQWKLSYILTENGKEVISKIETILSIQRDF